MIGLYLLLALGAGLVTFLSLPAWRDWSRRKGVTDEPGHRKHHAHSTPLAGGLAILTGLITPFILLAVVLLLGLAPAETAERLRYGFTHRLGQLSAIFAGAAA